MRTLQMGSRGADVRRLQQALNDQSNAGLIVDGIFGALTRRAVVKYQRSAGLADDGIAGPKTLASLGIGLDEPSPGQHGPSHGTQRLRSLHIGVNKVDPAQYDGWDGELKGCENDARTLQSVAARDGFATSMLLTREATSRGVLAAIASAAAELRAGDAFLLTYAGHGAQVPNVSDDHEEDQQDETWVLYDRMLLDDELEQAFAAFAPGVDIVLLSDSCHSGTVYRKMFDVAQLDIAKRKDAFYQGMAAGEGGARSFPVPAGRSSRGLDDERERELFGVALATLERKAVPQSRGGPSAYVSIFDRFEEPGSRGFVPSSAPRRFPGQESRGAAASIPAEVELVATRNMPLGVNASVVAKHASLYAELQAAVRSRGKVQANGVSISGCQDSQLSQEVGGHGVFTTTLTAVWNDSSFVGTFDQFHRAIVSRMGPTQVPQLGMWGRDPASLARKTPFA